MAHALGTLEKSLQRLHVIKRKGTGLSQYQVRPLSQWMFLSRRSQMDGSNQQRDGRREKMKTLRCSREPNLKPSGRDNLWYIPEIRVPQSYKPPAGVPSLGPSMNAAFGRGARSLQPQIWSGSLDWVVMVDIIV